jgi:phosphoserine phosphatase RsbU/P
MNTRRSIFNFMLGQRKAVLGAVGRPDRDHNHIGSTGDRQGSSVGYRTFVTPDYEPAGIIQRELDERQEIQPGDRSEQDRLCGQPAMAIRSATLETLRERQRLNRDLALAKQVQKRFLPRSVPVIPSFEFFAHYVSVYEVGGDYYDFIRLPDGRLAVAVGDVSGNGVAAGLLMARFSGDTRHFMLAGHTPPATANLLNGLLFESGTDEKFITLSLSVLDISTLTLSLISAGHPLMTIRRANGTVDEVGAEVAGYPLGIIAEADYQQTEVSLHPGDVVAVFTDGVTDARNEQEELYHSRNNQRMFNKLATTPGGPQAVGRAIVQDIREFSAGHPQADDVTLICFGPVLP